ncbi:MAG: hypothetical protein E5V92_30685 [Mesorhizobium sp.]|nr:MAG: hypothetical protein EOS61_23415 [Mesorhizobium sp.]TJW75276.1 MAG: hypothetical protein E5V92_30685 [Mesorhizobium sp.]
MPDKNFQNTDIYQYEPALTRPGRRQQVPKAMMKRWNLEKTIELEFAIASEHYQRFRLEALKSADEEGRYKIRLFDYDLFRVTPTFSEHPEGGSDHEIQFASNLLVDGDEYQAASADEALQIAIDRMRKQLLV